MRQRRRSWAGSGRLRGAGLLRVAGSTAKTASAVFGGTGSLTATFASSGVPPPVPTGLTGSAISMSSIQLSWMEGSGTAMLASAFLAGTGSSLAVASQSMIIGAGSLTAWAQ